MKLDVACGQSTRRGFHGVDISPQVGADTVHDLNVFPWPFDDDSAEEVFCSHYVEHTPDLFAFMDELWRVCAPGAAVKIVYPHLRSNRAFQDPTHVRFIPEETWDYFSARWRRDQKLDHYPVRCDFEVLKLTRHFIPPWDVRDEVAQRHAVDHFWNAVADVTVDLRAVK